MKKLIAVCLAVGFFCTGYVMAGTWQTIDMPGAGYTEALGIEGSNIVGLAGIHGFRYNGGSWATFDMSGAVYTVAQGISGSNIAGWYYDGSSYHGFLYNGVSWTTLDMPGVSGKDPYGTYARGIDGSDIVGYYYDGSHYKSFIYTIPEPGTMSLLALGGLAMLRRRRA